MHKHLSTFLYLAIGSFSFFAIAMQKPEEPISKRFFPNSLPKELTQEEEETKHELFGHLTRGLAAQFAAARGISTTNVVEQKQVIEPKEAEEAEEITPSKIAAIQIYDENRMEYLRHQVELAHQDSDRQNAAEQALRQEKARLKQVALASRKKVTAPEKMKDVVASTFAGEQSVQTISAPVVAPTLVTMPALTVGVDSITKTVVCYAQAIPQELTPSTPAAPSYDELDALLAGVDMVASKRVASNIPSQELDQLLADLESFSPQSTNPLYEDPSAADLGPIQRVKVVDILTSRLESFEQKVTDLAQTAHTVFDMHTNSTDKETVQAAQHILIREITSMNQEIDVLSHQLKLQPHTESLSAFNRLKNLTIGFKSGAENLGKLHQGVSISVPFISYTTCLESLIETISEKN